jgi:hypothetical protein
LVKSDPWPLIGITGLFAVFVFVSGMLRTGGDRVLFNASLVAILLQPPLLAGLFLRFVTKIRGEYSNAETAFAGFSTDFLQLLVGGFVLCVLITLGFYCLIIPGVFLLVAWVFTLPLIIDQHLDFWSAMELSRKVVSRHWFQVLGLLLALVLFSAAGALALVVGVVVTLSIAVAAFAYAYEDIFGAMRGAPTTKSTGPTGTQVLTPPTAAPLWPIARPAGIILAIAAAVFIIFLPHILRTGRAPQFVPFAVASSPVMIPPSAEPMAVPEPQPAPEPLEVLGDINERIVTNAINLRANKLIVLDRPRDAENSGEQLAQDIRKMEVLGVDAYAGGEPLRLFALGMTITELGNDDWDGATPEVIRSGLETTAEGEPLVSMQPQEDGARTYAFKTRDATLGILQVVERLDSPVAGMKIRYKLVQTINPSSADSLQQSDENLRDRLQAASAILSNNSRDAAATRVALDAARTGHADVVRDALATIISTNAKNDAAHAAALALAKRGMRKQAIDIATQITASYQRDATLAEIAK